MDRYAQLSDITSGPVRTVLQVIESETDPDGTNGEWVPCGDASPGWWTETGGAPFFAPEVAPDPRIWWVDPGPFKDRLGMDAPAIYASDHTACKGVVGLVGGRLYFDLKDPRIAAMLDVLIATEQPSADPVWPGSGPMTAQKRDAILSTPTTEEERHIKGLRG